MGTSVLAVFGVAAYRKHSDWPPIDGAEAPEENPPATTASLGQFPADEYLRHLREATSRVTMMDTHLDPLIEGDRARLFAVNLRSAIDAGCEVQVLLLHSQSGAVDERARQLAGTPADADADADVEAYRRRIKSSLRALNEVWDLLPADRRHRLQIRLAHSFPGLTCYQWDDHVLMSLFPGRTRVSESAPVLTLSTSAIGLFVQDRFHDLWQTSVAYTGSPQRLQVRTPSLEQEVRPHVVYRNGDTFVTFPDEELDVRLAEEARIEISMAGEEDEYPSRYQAHGLSKDGDAVLTSALETALRSKYGDDEHRSIFRLEPIDSVA